MMIEDELDIKADSYYYDFDFWGPEPVLYKCVDGGHCDGWIVTEKGYKLICIHCSDSDSQTIYKEEAAK